MRKYLDQAVPSLSEAKRYVEQALAEAAPEYQAVIADATRLLDQTREAEAVAERDFRSQADSLHRLTVAVSMAGISPVFEPAFARAEGATERAQDHWFGAIRARRSAEEWLSQQRAPFERLLEVQRLVDSLLAEGL